MDSELPDTPFHAQRRKLRELKNKQDSAGQVPASKKKSKKKTSG